MIARNYTSDGFGAANVRTNDDTTKAGLPCDEDTWAREEYTENPVPAVHNAVAYSRLSDSGEDAKVKGT